MEIPIMVYQDMPYMFRRGVNRHLGGFGAARGLKGAHLNGLAGSCSAGNGALQPPEPLSLSRSSLAQKARVGPMPTSIRRDFL